MATARSKSLLIGVTCSTLRPRVSAIMPWPLMSRSLSEVPGCTASVRRAVGLLLKEGATVEVKGTGGRLKMEPLIDDGTL